MKHLNTWTLNRLKKASKRFQETEEFQRIFLIYDQEIMSNVETCFIYTYDSIFFLDGRIEAMR